MSKSNQIQLSDHFTTGRLLKFTASPIIMMIFTSIYTIVDGFFVSNCAGKTAFTALNLIYPYIQMLGCLGFMIGTGGSALVAMTLGMGDEKRANRLFSMLAVATVGIGAIFSAIGLALLRPVALLLGATPELLPSCLLYGRILLTFQTAFMLQYLFQSFFIAAEKPKLGLFFTVAAGVTNMVLDFVLVGVAGLGLAGAALATAVSPMLSIAICSRHFFQKDNTVQFVRQLPSAKLLGQSCQLGISGFVGEMSSGVTTTVFNLLLLGLAGNVAVAAYGVVANFALVATAIFNGVAQGAQPLVSECYGKGDRAGTRKLLLLGSGTALVLAAVLYSVVFGATDALVGIFNSENSIRMAQFAHMGMRLYFIGYFFAGFNIVAAGYLSATDRPAEAAITSIFRGMAAIVVCSLVLSRLFGMNGVWAAFPVSELLTALLTLFLLLRRTKTE